MIELSPNAILAEGTDWRFVNQLNSDEHQSFRRLRLSVDGTLIQAWASMKSFRPKDGSGAPPAPGRNGERDFHGERRANDTHASTTDPEAKLFRKGGGKEAKLSFMGHLLMENRNGLIVDGRLSEAIGTAERDEAEAMVAGRPGRHPITVGGDKNFDTAGFVAAMRALSATPHVAPSGSWSCRRCRSAAKAGRAPRQIAGTGMVRNDTVLVGPQAHRWALCRRAGGARSSARRAGAAPAGARQADRRRPGVLAADPTAADLRQVRAG